MFKMPEQSYVGPLPALTHHEQSVSKHIADHCYQLAEVIGERNFWRLRELNAAADYIADQLHGFGLNVQEHTYSVEDKTMRNLYVEIQGKTKPKEVLVVGAHYDSVIGSPGANDNGSGIAALIELARWLVENPADHTILIAAFTNEEPPFYRTHKMGSLVFAKAMTKQYNIFAMICLETIGYYSQQPQSQQRPLILSAFYPDTANFIGFVGNIKSRKLVRQTIKLFRQHAQFPSEGIAAPTLIQGVGWSDHWSFWQCGIPAIMITDTAFYRYAFYHSELDTIDKISSEAIARILTGLQQVISLI